MEKITWKTEKRRVADLIPADYNPRKITDKEREDLAESIVEFNEVEPVVINTNNHLIGGHQRLKIYADLGREEIDVRVPSRELTLEEEKRLNLRLNKNTGGWDWDKLSNFDEELLRGIGFENEALDSIFEPDNLEDSFDTEGFYEKIKESKIKRGEVYQLGKHRLLCGDSTNQKDVEKLMDGIKADMVFTDPPYNVDYQGMKFEKIEGDNQPENQFIKFSEDFIARLAESVKKGGAFYICSGYSSFPAFLWALRKNRFEFSTPIIWVKNNTSLGWGDYRHKHEMVIKTRNPGGLQIKGRSKTKKAQPILYGWMEGKHFFPETRFEADVWEISRRASSTMVHPNQKPLELIGRAIRNSSQRGELVLDLFGGSGSTIISAEKEGRRCYVMEIDPKYCEVIIKRWEAYTKEKAQKIN